MNDVTVKTEILFHLEHLFHLQSRSGYDQSLLTDIRIQIQQIQQFRTLPALHSYKDNLEKDENDTERSQLFHKTSEPSDLCLWMKDFVMISDETAEVWRDLILNLLDVCVESHLLQHRQHDAGVWHVIGQQLAHVPTPSFGHGNQLVTTGHRFPLQVPLLEMLQDGHHLMRAFLNPQEKNQRINS